MAEVSWDTDDIRQDDRPYKFPLGWSRYVLMDAGATFEKSHYIQGLGQFLCTPPHCHWCEQGEEVRERFANNVFIYNTDQTGRPLDPLSGHMEWIAYAKDRFLFLKQGKVNYGDLRKCDIAFYCEEQQYQKGQLQIVPDAWWLKNAEFSKRVADMFRTQGIKDLSAKIGRRLDYQKQVELWQRKKGGQQANGQGNQGFNAAGAAAAAASRGYQPSFAPGGGMPSPGFMPNFGAPGGSLPPMGGHSMPGVPLGDQSFTSQTGQQTVLGVGNPAFGQHPEAATLPVNQPPPISQVAPALPGQSGPALPSGDADLDALLDANGR